MLGKFAVTVTAIRMFLMSSMAAGTLTECRKGKMSAAEILQFVLIAVRVTNTAVHIVIDYGPCMRTADVTVCAYLEIIGAQVVVRSNKAGVMTVKTTGNDLVVVVTVGANILVGMTYLFKL